MPTSELRLCVKIFFPCLCLFLSLEKKRGGGGGGVYIHKRRGVPLELVIHIDVSNHASKNI